MNETGEGPREEKKASMKAVREDGIEI